MARDGLRSLLLVEAEAGATELPAMAGSTGWSSWNSRWTSNPAGGWRETLRGLGFHYAGRHRIEVGGTVPPGADQMILNSEQDSAAAEHFPVPRTVGLRDDIRVDDARSQPVKRAEALLCPQWQDGVGSGERQIPALRARMEPVVYLVRTRPPMESTIYDRTIFIWWADEAPGPRR